MKSIIVFMIVSWCSVCISEEIKEIESKNYNEGYILRQCAPYHNPVYGFYATTTSYYYTRGNIIGYPAGSSCASYFPVSPCGTENTCDMFEIGDIVTRNGKAIGYVESIQRKPTNEGIHWISVKSPDGKVGTYSEQLISRMKE